ncbi:tetratricopeptide repeat protein [Leptolyngbya sp. FACHB-321]|uniref:CHAT domain-containing tetratricopeptide repeat protein n=1 Tax=Leptolyngbya sp. FACHB-321 TaxID=2692807 RepID=UPI001F54B3E1|nr:tetratricopeptide repeat protein [Leptolyngbya sp. FACHB-321]
MQLYRIVFIVAVTAFCHTALVPFVKADSPLAQQNGSRQTEADQLLEQGTQQYRTGQPTQAIATLQQALKLYQALADQPKVVKTLRNLGNAYSVMTNYPQAVAFYEQSLDLARKTKNLEGEAAALGNLGVIAINLGKADKAAEYYQQALTLYRQIKDRLGEGQMIGNLAEIAVNQRDYPKAIAAYQQAIVVAREIKDRRLEANSLGGLSVVSAGLGDQATSIDYSQQQLTLARSLDDRLGMAAALNNLGTNHYALSNYGKAIDYLDQRLVIARQIQDRLGEAQSLGNLSTVYYDLGDYNQAIDTAFKGLAIARDIQNPLLEASFLTKLGNLYLIVQDFPKAIEYHEKRLATGRAMKDTNSVTTAFTNLGNVYRSMGQYEKAIDYHQQALVLARQSNDKASESSALANLGVEYDELGQSDKAVTSYQQALAIARDTQDRATEGLVLNNLGKALFRLGKLAEAESALTSSLTLWESLRANLGNNDRNQISLFEQQARTYRLLQRVLVAQNKTDAALEIAERGRARAFVALLSRRLSGAETQPTAAVPATPPPTIAQIKQIAKAQNSTLVQYSITYEDILIDGKVQPREAELLIWAIAPDGTITFRNVDLTTQAKGRFALGDLVASSRETIGVSGRGSGAPKNTAPAEDLAKSQGLYQLLIQPIADALPKDPNARVTFIPQQSLFLVPFAALQDPAGKYLIERHTILTAPSIQVLALTQQQRERGGERGVSSGGGEVRRAEGVRGIRGAGGVRGAGGASRGEEQGVRTTNLPGSPLPTSGSLVVGNPTMPFLATQAGEPAEQLGSLPGAELEAAAIAPLLGTQAITGDRATKAAIVQRMPQERIIHLATHGLLDDLKGLGIPGAIALAPSGKDNGFLTADEILDLKLKAELVVLSACDTGRGRLTGDGVIGLSRSFIAAGVPSLVVSLWAVPDAPTAFLMTAFYQNLTQTPDKAQALRRAMLDTLKQYPKPQDWAAFTLIGEAE